MKCCSVNTITIMQQITRGAIPRKRFSDLPRRPFGGIRKLLKALRYIPRVIVTDKLRSHNAARTEVMPSVEHVQQKYQNNRAENSHQPTRLREKVMRGFKSAGHAQRFLSAFGVITSHFKVGRHQYGARGYRAVMNLRRALWEQVICSR